MAGLVKCVLLLCAAVAASGYSLGTNDVLFHLYSKNNPTVSQPLLPAWISIVMSSFNIQQPTIITVHDHGETVAGNFNAHLVPAHLAAEDVNVLAVDWSAGSGMYSQGLANAPQVGRIIASFANILSREFMYSPSNIRIVGHGLGGHIAGIAASNMDVAPPHIIALDPSFTGWSHHPERLHADNAPVVEVIHTTSGTLGYDYPLGDLDFYANGGSLQMGCGADISCSHMMAYIFYAESVSRDAAGGNRFVGTACDGYENAIVLQCSGDTNAHFGGSEVKEGASGVYSFMTNMQAPFARG